MAAGRVDYPAALASARALVAAGVTALQIYPHLCCPNAEACIDLFQLLMELKNAVT
jgi:hypothetical protein